MEEYRSVTKMFFGAGLVVAFVLLLTSFKVYAYEQTDLDYELFSDTVYSRLRG